MISVTYYSNLLQERIGAQQWQIAPGQPGGPPVPGPPPHMAGPPPASVPPTSTTSPTQPPPQRAPGAPNVMRMPAQVSR